jgi:hypothetical protein
LNKGKLKYPVSHFWKLDQGRVFFCQNPARYAFVVPFNNRVLIKVCCNYKRPFVHHAFVGNVVNVFESDVFDNRLGTKVINNQDITIKVRIDLLVIASKAVDVLLKRINHVECGGVFDPNASVDKGLFHYVGNKSLTCTRGARKYHVWRTAYCGGPALIQAGSDP